MLVELLGYQKDINWKFIWSLNIVCLVRFHEHCTYILNSSLTLNLFKFLRDAQINVARLFCVGWIFFWVAFFKSVDEESACLYDVNFGKSLHINLFLKYYTTCPRPCLSLSSHYGIIKSFDKQKLSFTRVQRIIQKAPDKLNLLKNVFPIPCHSITKFSKSTGCPIIFFLFCWTRVWFNCFVIGQ